MREIKVDRLIDLSFFKLLNLLYKTNEGLQAQEIVVLSKIFQPQS
jgi:hypothetical protein